MNTGQLIAKLKAERQKIDAVIAALERLEGTSSHARGSRQTGSTIKPKRRISAAARRKMSLAAKARWAARKAKTAKPKKQKAAI